MTPSKKFKIALLITDMNQAMFAKQHGVSKTMITLLLAGKTNSKRLEVAIKEFTNAQMIVLKNHLDNNEYAEFTNHA